MKAGMWLMVLGGWAPLALGADHAPPVRAPKIEYHGVAVVHRAEPIIGLVNVTHGAVPAAGWQTATRDLRVRPRSLAAGLKPGMTIKFQLSAKDPLTYEITAIEVQR